MYVCNVTGNKKLFNKISLFSVVSVWFFPNKSINNCGEILYEGLYRI